LWLRLGEAYGKAGRYAAAIKALEHAYELDPTDWLAQFYIADAQQGVGLFKQAIKILESLLEQRPSELGILSSLATAYLDMGVAEMEQGFVGRAEESFVSAVSTTLKFLADHPGFRTVGWKVIADATFHLSQVSLFRNEEAVLAVLAEVHALLPSENARLKDIIPSISLESPVGGSEALLISILSAEYRVSLNPTNSDTSAWYDLGMGVRAWSILSGNQGDEKVGQFIVDCITEAVKREPTNPNYWTALGTAYFVSNPRAAQHSFIKALEIENKSAATWCDLGLLYLFHEDTELAKEAFQRAQVLDPDCTLAWVGQALILRSLGDERGATALFSHATGLDHAIVRLLSVDCWVVADRRFLFQPEADYNLSLRVFNSVNERKLRRREAIGDLLPIFFLLNRYCTHQPDDATGLHLFALVCEKLGHIDFAKELVNRAMRILERIYEEKEDPVVERQFMVTNATLGRLLLATYEPEEGMIIFETVLGLLHSTDELKQVLETQAKLGIAMAQCTLRDMQEGILSLQHAQGIAPDHEALRAQCAILLAQTLWSIRDPECCELAKGELLKLYVWICFSCFLYSTKPFFFHSLGSRKTRAAYLRSTSSRDWAS
jgi:superkiller protein 3